MSLLREIRDAAIDQATPLAVVLRKSMVLAASLGHEGFKKWVDDELNGYPPEVPLPSYRRVTDISSVGTFIGPLGRQFVNVPLRLAPLPEDLRDRYSTAEFRESVANLEAMLTDPERGSLGLRWSPDLIAAVAGKFYEGYVLMSAHMEVPWGAVAGVLDAVRNKTLKFALEIEEQSPGAGDAAPGTKPVPVERVSQIFNTFIMGEAQNVAVGRAGFIQRAQQIRSGDRDELKRILAEHGVAPADLTELERALDEDDTPEPGQPFGRRVADWIAKMAAKAASGAWNISASTAANLLSGVLRSYYGLPS